MDSTQIDQNRTQQAVMYGAPLGESVRRIAERLDLSQAAIGRVLGVSAPMLSQLVSGQRIKLGNPLAVHRLGALLELCEEVDAGLPHDRIGTRLEQVAESAATITTQRTQRGVATADAATAVALVQGLLRTVASGRQLQEAADLLAADQPEVAELLRVYGAGPRDAAVAHYGSISHLL